MSKFRKKPVVIEATQWFAIGDHPAVHEYTDVEFPLGEKGRSYVETMEGPLRVSPGDWIITGVKGELYPVKSDIFAATYEAVK